MGHGEVHEVAAPEAEGPDGAVPEDAVADGADPRVAAADGAADLWVVAGGAVRQWPYLRNRPFEKLWVSFGSKRVKL